MHCEIYRSSKKDQTYLYVKSPIDRDELPDALLSVLGELSLVMELEITGDTKLATEDSTLVIAEVGEKGFYLQMPPKIDQ